ncbi:aroma-sacti cluster domain-containing protein [Streptomyces sp. NPDC058671]|uniref:aroma-sacti cluster domain-containing protein n=1 Tax=unclassified Streptomyces TaxID=2593676 RepID=UPI00364A53F3
MTDADTPYDADSASSGPPSSGPLSEPTVEALAAAGFDVDALSDEQHEVLRALTREELALLVDIRGRLDAAAPEVQAHADVAGGALF